MDDKDTYWTDVQMMRGERQPQSADGEPLLSLDQRVKLIEIAHEANDDEVQKLAVALLREDMKRRA
jgi:hypothetical protein